MELTNLQGNWVDLVILIVFAYYISEAWRVGLWAVLSEFAAFLSSLVLSLRFYPIASEFLRTNFAITNSLSNALGYLFIASISEMILSYSFSKIVMKIPEKYWNKSWSKALGIFPALGEGIVLSAFVLTLVLSLPITPQVKEDITDSKIGGVLVSQTAGLEAQLTEIFGGAVEDSLTYLTIKQGSQESIPLTSNPDDITEDSVSEIEMMRLVNEERKKNNLKELSLRTDLIPVARAHATDMWMRGYFGHVSPDGKDVGARLTESGVRFGIAGENLALAPTLATAHNGLMNSPGHRANILEPRFTRVGIGVIDNGIYGKMFVQIFTD